MIFFLFITRVRDVPMTRLWAVPLRPKARPSKQQLVRYMPPPPFTPGPASYMIRRPDGGCSRKTPPSGPHTRRPASLRHQLGQYPPSLSIFSTPVRPTHPTSTHFQSLDLPAPKHDVIRHSPFFLAHLACGVFRTPQLAFPIPFPPHNLQ